MFEREELYRRRCVKRVIDVVEALPSCWRARSPMVVDETSTGLLLLWSWLHFDRDFPARCLEALGTDLSVLSRRVDELLNERRQPPPSDWTNETRPLDSDCPTALREMTALWLDQAGDEAKLLHQDYLSMEHLLLAFLYRKNSPLAMFLAEFGIDAQRLTKTILDAIEQRRRTKPDAKASTSAEEQDSSPPSGVGLQKRFSMGVLMAWVTLFAVTFSVLKWMDAAPTVFAIIAILMFCVGIAQMWLFGGKNPRMASLVAGGVVLPVEILFCNLLTSFFVDQGNSIFLQIVVSIALMIPAVPIGVFLGYLLGGLTAGIVLVLDRLENRKVQTENDFEVVSAEVVEDKKG